MHVTNQLISALPTLPPTPHITTARTIWYVQKCAYRSLQTHIVHQLTPQGAPKCTAVAAKRIHLTAPR